jgi:small conductance mechanosensitive channel
MSELWQWLQPRAAESLEHLAAVGLILFVIWLIYRISADPLRRFLVRLGISAAVVSFLFNSLRILVLTFGLVSVLQQLGVQTASLLTLLGAVTVAVSLALQGMMSNFAAGLVLLAYRMVHLGDTIEAGDVRGTVVELLPFHVVLETADHVKVTLPNSTLINGAYRNLSASPTRRVQWLLPVPVRLDLEKVKEALRGVLRGDGRVLAVPAPTLFVQDWSSERRVLAVQAWAQTADAGAVQESLLEGLGKAVEGLLGEKS